MSAEADGFQDFFIEEWGKKATLRDNREALMALYNKLLNIASKCKSDREIMNDLLRQHPDEGEDSE